jgi:hypothetical protein
MVSSIAAVIALVIVGLGLSAWGIRRRSRGSSGPATEEGTAVKVESPGVDSDEAGLLDHLLGQSPAAPAEAGGAGKAPVDPRAGNHGEAPRPGGGAANSRS